VNGTSQNKDFGVFKNYNKFVVKYNVAKTMGMEVEINILVSLTRSLYHQVAKEAKGNLWNLFLGKTIKCVFNFCLQ
jgi:hypothetical protein